MTAVTLSRSAPWASPEERRWNWLLREINAQANGGASQRFAWVRDRRFRVDRTSWNSGWFVTEVFADGKDIWIDHDGNETEYAYSKGASHEMKFCVSVSRLADAARAIAEEVG